MKSKVQQAFDKALIKFHNEHSKQPAGSFYTTKAAFLWFFTEGGIVAADILIEEIRKNSPVQTTPSTKGNFK
jgi:hypothetical protein